MLKVTLVVHTTDLSISCIVTLLLNRLILIHNGLLALLYEVRCSLHR